MQSAFIHPDPINKYISEEVSEGHIIDPLSPQWRAVVQVSCFGAIPKPH